MSDIQASSEKVEIKTGDYAPMHNRKFFGMFLIVIAAVLLLGFLFPSSGNFPRVDRNKWQAIFLNNNQVYFGHVRDVNKAYVALTDIFYLRIDQPLQQGANPAAPPISLVKLGGELHGPEDLMYVPKANIMFWENLKPDSQVIQAISNFLAQQPQQ